MNTEQCLFCLLWSAYVRNPPQEKKKQKVYKYAASLDLSIRSGLSSRVERMLMAEKFSAWEFTAGLSTPTVMSQEPCASLLETLWSVNLLSILRSVIWAFANNSGFPRQRARAKAQWYTLHSSEGSLPRHNLMANLAIRANSLFPQMSPWLGTWASMHMHTHSPLAQYTFPGDRIYGLIMACCLTMVCLHVSVGMVTCMLLTCWLNPKSKDCGPKLPNHTFHTLAQPEKTSDIERWENVYWLVYLSW